MKTGRDRAQPEPAWQDEILRVVPSGIDQAQLDAFARLSPTERLEEMRRVLVQLEEARLPHGDRLPRAR
jgi:hypothetical protein